MNKDKVNISQLALLLLMVITGGKFLSLPSVLAQDVGHDSWLVLCTSFLWDAVGLCFLLWAVKLNSQRLDIGQMLDRSISKVGKVVVMAMFFVIFMCRVLVLLNSCYDAFAVTFDVNTNWVLFVLPILGVAGFAVFRGFHSIARAGQILFGLVLLAIVALLVYPLTQTQFSALLPVGEAGFGKIIGTAFGRSFWFSDYIFIYFVLDELKPAKRVFAPMLTSFAVGVVLTVLLNAVFVALFGSLAQSTDLAMSKIGMFSVSKSTDGRWDWLTLTVWLVSVIVKIIIFIFCAYKCVEKIFGSLKKFRFVVMGVIGLVLMLPLFVPVSAFLQVVYTLVIPFALVQYLLPLFMPLIARVANKQEVQHEQP